MSIRFPPLAAASDELLHLDFVRFVASLGIVFHHSHEFFYTAADRGAFTERTTGLALFVDLFFLISGYVIAHVYRLRVGSLSEFARFMQRRCGRLVPLHWLTLFLSIALWGVLSKFVHSNHQPDFSPYCIANNALLLHAMIGCGKVQFNYASWSISAEMAMYVLFPLIALLGARRRTLPLLIGLVTLVAVFIFTYGTALESSNLWTQLPPVLRALPSFLIGAGLSYNRSALIARLPAPQYLLGATLFLLICAMLTGAPEPIQLLLTYAVGISAVSSDASQSAGRLIRKLAPLGQLTYSIYMWHILFIFVIMNIIGDKLLSLHGAPMLCFASFCYIMIFIWSYLSFTFIETPARRWIDGLFKGQRQIHGLAKEPASA